MARGVQVLWNKERPLLNKIASNKGFKRTPYKRKRPPTNSVSGLLHIMHTVELKKPKSGHVRSYRKTYEHKLPFPSTGARSRAPRAPAAPAVRTYASKDPKRVIPFRGS